MQGGSKKHQHRTFSSLNTQGLILIKLPGHYELEPNFDVPFADIQRKIVSLLDTEKRRYTNPMEKSIDRIEYADSNLGLEWRVKHKKPNRPYSSYLTPAKNTPQRPATSKSFGGYGKQEVSPPQRAVSRRDARTDKFRSKLEIPSDYEEVYISKKPVSVKFPIKMTSPPRMSAAGKSKRLTTAQETGEVHLTRTNVLDSAETSEKTANRKYLFRSKRSAVYPSSHFELRSPQLRIHENSVTRSKSKPKTQEYKFKLGEPTRHPLETNMQLVKPKKASLRKENSRDRSDDRVDRTTVLQQVPLNWITIHGVRSSLMQQEESSVHIRGEADSQHRQRIESKITVEILTEDQAEQHNQEQLQATSSSETLKKTSNGKKLLKDSLDEPNEFRTSPGPFDRRAYNERKTLHAAMQQSRDTSHIRRGKDPSPFKLNRRSFQNRSASEQVGASQDASDDRTKHRDSMRAAKEAAQNQMNSPTKAKRQGSPKKDSSKVDESVSRGRMGIPSQTSKRSVSPPEVLRVSPLRMRSPKEDDIFIVKPQNLQVSDASSPSEDPSPLTPVKFSARQHSLMIQPTDAMSEGLYTRPLTAQPKQAEESNNEAAQELKSSPSNKMRDGFAPFQESAVWGLSQFTDQVKIPIPPGRSTSEKNPIGLSSKQANPTTGPAPIAKVFEISALPKIQHCEDWKPRVILNERYYYSKPLKKEVSKPPGSSTLHHSGLSEDLYIVPSSWLCPLPIPPVSLVLVTAERWAIRVEKKELIQPTNNQQESPGIVSHLLEGHLSHSMDSPKKTRLHYLRSAIKDIQKHGYPFPSTSSTPKSMIKMVPVPPGANNSQPNTERGMMTGFQTPPMILITNPAAVGQYSGTTSRNSHRGQDSQEPIIDRTQGVLKIPDKKMFLKRVISLKDQPELLGPPQANLQFSISGDSAAMSKKVYTNQAHGSQMEVSRFHPPTQNSEQPPNSAGRSINSAAQAQSGRSPGSLHSMGIGSKSSKTSLFNLIRENKLVSFLGKTENSRGGFVKPASDAYRQALRNEKHKILRKNVSLAQPKIVMKAFGDLRGIVVNTSSGASMNYNEDRITVLVKAHEKFEGLVQRGIQTCNYLALYDGHGGSECADFLKDTLHVCLMKNLDAKDPITSIKESVKQADLEFLQNSSKQNKSETSGSCALGLINFDQKLYFFNTGDSSAVLSSNRCTKVEVVTGLHRPDSISEMVRVFKNGGKIYRISMKEGKKSSELLIAKSREEFLQISKMITDSSDMHTVYSPWRIKPGGLTVTRSIGDADSKLKEKGGLVDVIISEPEVVEKPVTPDMDFVLLGSDGVFDFVDPKTAVRLIWDCVAKHDVSKTQDGLAEGINSVLSQSLSNGSDDNLSLMVGLLPGFERYLNDSVSTQSKPLKQ